MNFGKLSGPLLLLFSVFYTAISVAQTEIEEQVYLFLTSQGMEKMDCIWLILPMAIVIKP